jgi:hypothetical protein
MSIFIEKEIELRTVLEIEESNLLNIYNNILIQKNDSYSLKQHLKIVLYILFINEYQLYINSINRFIHKIKLIKKFLKYKLHCYFYNEIHHNYTPKKIDNRMIYCFLNEVDINNYKKVKCYENYTGRISGIIYNKVQKIVNNKKKQNKNKIIIENFKSDNLLYNLTEENCLLLNNIKKNKIKININSTPSSFSCFPSGWFSTNINDIFEPRPYSVSKILQNQKELDIIIPSSKNNSESIFSFDEYINSQELFSNEITNLDKNIEISNNIIEKINKFKLNVEQIRETCKQMKHEKKQNIKNINEKNYCKRTILLDVDLLVSTLNNDIINYIKEFVGERFIKNTRNLLIQTKYSLGSPEKMEYMLYKWSIKQLLKFQINSIYFIYDFDSVSELNVHDYTSEDFLIYFNDFGICDLFVNIIYPEKKIKIIKKIISNIRMRNYFHFQKDIWILTYKIMKLNH